MKEIGGYFGFEQFHGQEYHSGLIALNSARNSLLYLMRARKIQKLYIPYYLCDSVSMVCDHYGFAYDYYHIAPDFTPDLSLRPKQGECVYIVNYFGQFSNEAAVDFKKHYGSIVFDNVQAFFQRPVSGIDTVYSCRKFFGVPDGGYVSTDAAYPEKLVQDSSRERMKHVLGRLESSASKYYQDFHAIEQLIDSMPLASMSPVTKNILQGVDYEFVRCRRNENYATLARMLGESNRLHPIQPDGPYVYPYYVKNGMETRKKLAQKNIYVATLWPNVLQHDAPLECDYTQNILPLPCDQRYDTEDMQRIAFEIIHLGGIEHV